VTEALDGAVEIYDNSKWKSELQQKGFFGGDAELTFQLLNTDGSTLGDVTTWKFYIGGKNPDDAKCKAFIDRSATSAHGNMWFAYAIAKSESKDYNGEGSRYNQFWDKASRFAKIEHKAGEVLWANNPDEDPPKGFGMFQVTGNKYNEKADIPRKQLWNWQDNVLGGLEIIRSKRDAAYYGAWDYMNGTMKQEGSRTIPRGRRLQAKQDMGHDVGVPDHTVRSVTFKDGTEKPIEDAETIRLYNGGHYLTWDRSAHVWKFMTTNKYGFNYVDRVCQEVEP
jgi:hypothetical protein